MANQQCRNCKFWELSAGQMRSPKVGKCRRLPPTVVGAYPSISPSTMTRFPEIAEHAWCGEWQRAPKQTEKKARQAKACGVEVRV